MTEMAPNDAPLELGKEFLLQLPAPLTVLAASEQIELLRKALGASWLGDATLHPLALDEPVTDAHLGDAEIVVLQVDPSVPQSMDRIHKLHAQRPDIAQIVALDNADMRLVRTLVREGVADVVGLPLDPEEILQAAVAILEVRSAQEQSSIVRAPLIAVTRALGGGGATTLVTHLAQRFADAGGSGGCCVIDLDVQFGRAAEVLGVSPRRTLSDLLEAGNRLDGAFLRSVVAKSEHGVSLVAAPQEIVPLEAIDTKQLLHIIDVARQEFDFVLLDMPSNLTNWSLSVAARTDTIVLIVEQTLSSLRQARRRLDLFRSVGLDTRKIAVVVNRMERRLFGSISLSDVSEAVGQDVECGLALDNQSLSEAQDQGLLVEQIRPKSPFAADATKLAELLRGRIQRANQL